MLLVTCQLPHHPYELKQCPRLRLRDAYLLNVGLLKEFCEDEYARGGSGVLYELSCSCTLGRFGHEQERLKLCNVLRSNFHLRRWQQRRARDEWEMGVKIVVLA